MQESRGLKGLLMGQLDTRSTDAGTRVLGTADSLKKIAAELQNDELSRSAASLATRGAESLERVGEYLKEADGHRLVSDAERFGRTRPWAVATGGFLLGLAGSRMLKAAALRRNAADADDAPYRAGTSYGGTSNPGVASGFGYTGNAGIASPYAGDLGSAPSAGTGIKSDMPTGTPSAKKTKSASAAGLKDIDDNDKLNSADREIP